MVEMRVRGICRCRRHPLPSILLEDAAGKRLLAIAVPPGEAERIAHEMRRSAACEPSIFTALLEALRVLGAAGPTLWLNLGNNELVGGIGLTPPGREIVIRCAPRDVATLAAVAGIPVQIGRALAHCIEAAQPGAEACGKESRDSVAEWLERVKPEDFA